MPHIWNNILVVTFDELVPKWYNSKNHLGIDIYRYQNLPYGIKKVRNGSKGRPMLVAFDSLSERIKEGIGDPRKHGHLLEIFYTEDSEAVTFYADFNVDGNYLSIPHQSEYITNASVLKACIALKAAREHERTTKGGSLKGLMSSVYRDATTFNKCLQAKHGVQHTLPTSEKRFKEVFKAFLNDGYKSLISAKIFNTNAKKVTDVLLKLLNAMFADRTAKPTRTEISRQYDAFLGGYLEIIDEETGELYDPKDFKPLTERSILGWLGKWEERIGTYALRSGDRQKFMGQFKPYHSLSKPSFAGSILSIDDRQPPFEYAQSKRVWFYNGIDLGSEAFTCWVHGKTKDGIIIDFYRQLIRNYTQWGLNLPAELEAESNLNSSFKDTFLRPGAMFQHCRIEANNARGKRIERYYGTLRYQFEKDKTGWLARPFARSESNQAGNQPVPMIPYQQIVQNSLKDIEDWNNMPHSVHTSKTRWEVFMEMQHPHLKPTNWRAILPHLGYKQETSCNTGIVKLQKGEFLLGDDNQIYTGEKLINLMKKVEGKTFDVYWIDGNDGEVLKAVIMMNNTYICELLPKPVYNRAKIERTPQDTANQSIMYNYVETIDKYMRRKASEVIGITIIDKREKTLNRSFVIPEVKVYEPREGKAENLTEPDEMDEGIELPTITTRNTAKTLRDRY